MTTHYTRTAKGLHWLMAILFFGLLALGFYMHAVSYTHLTLPTSDLV